VPQADHCPTDERRAKFFCAPEHGKQQERMMAANNNDQHPNKPLLNGPMYGDGASLHLYAGSNQDMIGLRLDWNPKPTPALLTDLFLEIQRTFSTDQHDRLNDFEKETYSG
jgi:hypothetical protein